MGSARGAGGPARARPDYDRVDEAVLADDGVRGELLRTMAIRRCDHHHQQHDQNRNHHQPKDKQTCSTS
jgi:hypothetical protein